MPHFVLTCLDKKNAHDLRMANREAHLAYVRARLDRVKLGGPLLDAKGEMIGSMLIFEVDDIGEVEAFVAGDPYNTSGLFEVVEIRPYRVTVGGLS